MTAKKAKTRAPRKISLVEFFYRVIKKNTEKAIASGGAGHKPAKKAAKKGRSTGAPTKAEKIAEIVGGADFGCAEGAVREILSIIIGKKIPKVSKKEEEIGNAIVGMYYTSLCAAVEGGCVVLCLDGSDTEWLNCDTGKPNVSLSTVGEGGDEDGGSFLDVRIYNAPTIHQMRKAAGALAKAVKVDANIENEVFSDAMTLYGAWEAM